jgi:hypothetical protein
MREGHANEPDISRAVQKLIGAQRAFSEEDQRKGAQALCRKLLRVGVHAESSGPEKHAAGYAEDFSLKWVMKLQEAAPVFRDGTPLTRSEGFF